LGGDRKIEKIQFYREEIKASLDKLKTENVSIFKEVTNVYNHLDLIYMMLEYQENFNKVTSKHVDRLNQEE